MGTFSIWHWLIVLVVVLVLFGGGGKLSRIMGDVGAGLKNFKKNVKDETASSETKLQQEKIDEKTDSATLNTEIQEANASEKQKDQ
ncbi:MAG: twin-arginine translocase TatA/TatE family subunit [Alphaproteobacteria bacterium]